MSGVTIRPVRERDIEAIIGIDATVTGTGGAERAGFWRGLLSIHTAIPEDDASTAAEPPAARHLCQVAEVPGPGGGRVVGFIIGDVQAWQFGLPRHGRIVTIGVHPEHRRIGVASRLVEALLASFRKMGLPFVHCLARPGDPLGEFFRALGFEAPGFEILERSLTRAGPVPH